MTIACSWCKKLIGEKCPMCGDPADRAGTSVVHYCRNASCGIISFEAGAGGSSDGICESCRRRQFPLVPAVAPESAPITPVTK